MIRKLAEENDRVDFIYYGDYLNGQDGFYNNNYHFTPVVYYKVAARMCEIINSDGNALSTVSTENISNPIVDFCVRRLKSIRSIGK